MVCQSFEDYEAIRSRLRMYKSARTRTHQQMLNDPDNLNLLASEKQQNELINNLKRSLYDCGGDLYERGIDVGKENALRCTMGMAFKLARSRA